MRGIRAKQVAGVAAIVGLTVVGLSVFHLARLASLLLQESHARVVLVADTIFHRAREVVRDTPDPYAALAADPGLRAILEASLYGEGITGAAVVDADGVVVAHSDAEEVGRLIEARDDLGALAAAGPLDQLAVLYSRDGQTLEVRQEMALGDEIFGSIHVGVSTLLMRQALQAELGPQLLTALAILLAAVLASALLAGRLLRPIHVLSSSLSRLGRGEPGVVLDLRSRDELGDLGASFDEVSRQVAAGQRPSVARAQATLGRLTAGLAHEVKNPLNAMRIHLELLRAKVRSAGEATPRPAAVAAGGGTLGLAEAAPAPMPDSVRGALEHATVIETELRRLDEVVQGFVKFTRPEDLEMRPVQLSALVGDLVPLIEPDATAHDVRVRVDCPPSLWVRGDQTTLGQALLTLALNACQAMSGTSGGGTLRILAREAQHDRVELRVEDTGAGIAPEQLGRIFDLYFTTRKDKGGSGLGLSMVYRIVQMHDGEIDVESTPGEGTTFRVVLPGATTGE
jgi:signal transduction histidine kinase